MDHPYFWDSFWARKNVAYNRQHQKLWEYCSQFLIGKVADLGCGPCVMYENKDIDLTGIDFSSQAIVEAKKHYPRGRYLVAEAANTGLTDKEFDSVIMLGLLDYFEDWSPILTEVRRIAKPGAPIVASLLHTFQGHDWSEENVRKKASIKSYIKLTHNWVIITI